MDFRFEGLRFLGKGSLEGIEVVRQRGEQLGAGGQYGLLGFEVVEELLDPVRFDNQFGCH